MKNFSEKSEEIIMLIKSKESDVSIVPQTLKIYLFQMHPA
ncbi:hypothetical protein ASZ90_006263 [hydrocarbon metagenome]|uniref:Uncharacterized protein n=1 Tax=hydrocarbon metagenome TaxID=938273 RepID=A0A0W8FSQ8_9ZZZZ